MISKTKFILKSKVCTHYFFKKKYFSSPFNFCAPLFQFSKSITIREAINTAIAEELENDEKVFLIGEEVGTYHGAYKISKGLLDKFGKKRVIDTPISETGFTGISVGASMYGLKPIVEFMTWNFALQSIDHIINSAAKLNYMSAGDLSTSIVFRGINGAAASVGAQHSQCFASWFGSVPGLTVLTPYDVEDYRGLFKAAVRGPNPVVFLENEIMYGDTFTVDDRVLDKNFTLPIGKAKVMQEGKHCTIVAFSKMVKFSIEAAKELEKYGISCEVINLRSIKPLDRETIVKSVKKTGRLVAVEEGWPQSGVMSEICALMMETSAFDYLDAPVVRVTGVEVPLAYSFNLEPLSLPKPHNIVKAVRQACQGLKL